MDTFSIKNNCRTPYCTKLISDWTAYPDGNVKTLAYVTIPRKYFDPIVDPDLINYNYVNKDEGEEKEKSFEEVEKEILSMIHLDEFKHLFFGNRGAQ